MISAGSPDSVRGHAVTSGERSGHDAETELSSSSVSRLRQVQRDCFRTRCQGRLAHGLRVDRACWRCAPMGGSDHVARVAGDGAAGDRSNDYRRPTLSGTSSRGDAWPPDRRAARACGCSGQPCYARWTGRSQAALVLRAFGLSAHRPVAWHVVTSCTCSSSAGEFKGSRWSAGRVGTSASAVFRGHVGIVARSPRVSAGTPSPRTPATPTTFCARNSVSASTMSVR